MMQRRYLNADLKEGFSWTASPRALLSLLPMVASLAHEGIYLLELEFAVQAENNYRMGHYMQRTTSG